MKYITVISIFGIIAYNLFGTEAIVKDVYGKLEIGTAALYWSFHYSFFCYAALISGFFKLRQKYVLYQDRAIMLVGAVFFMFYLFYQFLILFNGPSGYFYSINSQLWSIIAAIFGITLLLIYLNYDRKMAR